MIDSIYITQTISSDSYIFQIEVSGLAIERLKRERVLGLFDIRKSKYEFLNDLRDVLAEEIVKHFEMIEGEK